MNHVRLATFAPLVATILLLVIHLPALAQDAGSLRQSAAPIRMEVFVRGDSDLSQRAAAYASQLAERHQGLQVTVHDVLQDRDQLTRLWKLAKKSGRDKPVVPAFYCCGQMHYGFSSEQESGDEIQNLFTVDVYTRSTCSRCQAGKAYITSILQPRWPALRFRIYEITYDTAARQRYEELCRSRGQVPGLPTLHFAGQVIIGYQSDSITGAQWKSLIERVTADPLQQP
jgi:hypothetical protein